MGWKKKVARALESWSFEPAPPFRAPSADPAEAALERIMRRFAEVERAGTRRADENEASRGRLETALHEALHQHGCRIAEVESAITARQTALDARLEAVATEVSRATEQVSSCASEIEATIVAAEHAAVDRMTELCGVQSEEIERLRSALESLIGDIAPERVRSASRLSELESLTTVISERMVGLARELGTFQDRLIRQAAAHEQARRAAQLARRVAVLGFVLAAGVLAIEIVLVLRGR